MTTIANNIGFIEGFTRYLEVCHRQYLAEGDMLQARSVYRMIVLMKLAIQDIAEMGPGFIDAA